MTNKEKFKEVFEKTFGFVPEDSYPCPEKCPEEFVNSSCSDSCPYAYYWKKEYKKPETMEGSSKLRIEVAKIVEDLGNVLAAHSPIPSNEVVGFICLFLDTLTGDDLPLEFDLVCVRSDMAEMILKEWPHSAEYYIRKEKKKE